jgi:hypothetical protein
MRDLREILGKLLEKTSITLRAACPREGPGSW